MTNEFIFKTSKSKGMLTLRVSNMPAGRIGHVLWKAPNGIWIRSDQGAMALSGNAVCLPGSDNPDELEVRTAADKWPDYRRRVGRALGKWRDAGCPATKEPVPGGARTDEEGRAVDASRGRTEAQADLADALRIIDETRNILEERLLVLDRLRLKTEKMLKRETSNAGSPCTLS
jgi:hypothetical protein